MTSTLYRNHMMRCSDFIQEYSDYRDGLMRRDQSVVMEEHAQACSSCARYDRIITGGVADFVSIPDIQPSEDFIPRLYDRLDEMERHTPGTSGQASGASVGVAVALLVAIVSAAWAPVVVREPAAVQLSPIAVVAPHQADGLPVLFREGPLLAPEPVGLYPFRPLGRFASNASVPAFRASFPIVGRR